MTGRIEPPAGDEIQVWKVALGGGGRAAARAALGELLAEYLGTAEPPELSIDGGGKPRPATAPISFNLSHSGELALIAIAAAGVEVGVDVERLRPRRDVARLAARWLPAADAEAVAAAGDAVAGQGDDPREAVFYAAWTRHEARVKCTGAGLSGPPPPDTVVAHQIEVDPGYAAAVAFDRDLQPRISVRPFVPARMDPPPRG
jgi:4'-phosphopantetheinyl transferase